MEAMKGLGDLATAAASMITILTLIALLASGVRFLLGLPDRVRAYFMRPKYILVPTAEEIARYCEKSFDGKRPTKFELWEEYRGRLTANYRRRIRIIKTRIKLVSLAFSLLFSGLIIRLCYLASLDGERRDAIAYGFFSGVYFWLMLVILWLSLIDPVRAKAQWSAALKFTRSWLSRY